MRKGFTTGTCAQAAAKAAAFMLTNRRIIDNVEIETASGARLNLNIVDQQIGNGFARCAVIKDSGDDPDVTNGIKIYAQVSASGKKGVAIKAGEGIGKVTKPGLAVKAGEPAINPTPRKMILKEVSEFLPKEKGLEVTISAPEGEELASRTFNPKLGIIGGISIIGTTGIVEPKSQDAYKASLSLQLDMLKAQGHKKAVLVLGYVGEKFCKTGNCIKIGDHVGFMLDECVKKGFSEVVLIGYIGKLIKLAVGQFDTNIKFGDNRLSTIAEFASRCGAAGHVVEEILSNTTAEAAIDILKKNKLTNVFGRIAEAIDAKIKEFVKDKISVTCIILSLQGESLTTV